MGPFRWRQSHERRGTNNKKTGFCGYCPQHLFLFVCFFLSFRGSLTIETTPENPSNFPESASTSDGMFQFLFRTLPGTFPRGFPAISRECPVNCSKKFPEFSRECPGNVLGNIPENNVSFVFLCCFFTKPPRTPKEAITKTQKEQKPDTNQQRQRKTKSLEPQRRQLQKRALAHA